MKLTQACNKFTLTTAADDLAASTMKLNKAASLLVDWMIEQGSHTNCTICDSLPDEENTVCIKSDDNTD